MKGSSPSLRARWRLLCLMWVVSLILVASSAAALTLTILHTNDLHGHLDPFPDPYLGQEAGGVARLAALINSIRQENP